jgi:septal ring factor EnvC (AmiA/AmiB activator)
MKPITRVCCALMLAAASLEVAAIETAPRITDREIIEALTRLEAGQQALVELMNQRFEGVDQRFDSVDQRFESVNQQFIGVDQRFQGLDQRFESINQRFESMERYIDQRFSALDKRLDDQFAMMLTMFSAIILLIVSLFGYIVWDRRTALRPLESRLAQLEQDLERDLQLRHEQGSLPTRLLNALRNLASEDDRLAGVLRSFSLL